MVTIVASSPEVHWFGTPLSPTLGPSMLGPGPAGPPPAPGGYRRSTKADVCAAFIDKLRERRNLDLTPQLVEGVEQHFRLLPSRYALDVNIGSLDVLNHKRLLDSARADPNAVSFQVRPVDVVSAAGSKAAMDKRPSFGNSESLLEAALASSYPRAGRELPRPAFGSSPNLQALLQEADSEHSQRVLATQFYEVTIASVDQPRLLSRLSEALGDLNLNICEAHAFNTHDRFSLDVFVVTGWNEQGTQELEELLSERLQQLPQPLAREASGSSPATGGTGGQREDDVFPFEGEGQDTPRAQPALERTSGEAAASAPADDWELDPAEINFQEKIASGAFGDLYRGSYCGQEVAIKILRDVHGDSQQYQEFLQEVAIMRKVRHKNVVQFIGACTRKPNLCIVFEFMPAGSMYDHLRKSPLRLSALLKAATEVCRGMDYLHKRRIVHRDLKAANLLTDETGAVKIGDFGVARVLDTAGVMTAETGTYRWMAPEVIEHNPYDEKADVFSFGVVLWELLTGRVPYQELTPLQAAVGVVQKGLRPTIPPDCPPPLADVMRRCWVKSPVERPSFEALKVHMEELWQAARQEEGAAQRKSSPQGILTKWRKSFK